VKKLLELASRSVAEVLNTLVFGAAGPVKPLASIFSATGDRTRDCLLQNCIPDGYDKSIFSVSVSEAAAKPLVKRGYNPNLHLAISMLRCFNAELNSTEVGGEPVCNLHSEESEYIKGAGSLPPYSHFYHLLLSKVLPKLSPIHADMFTAATTPTAIDDAVDAFFPRFSTA
jgi:hypothetical protein